MLFLIGAVSRLKGRWQMATQGALGGAGLLQTGGPFAVRQACCAFLEFAALAADHEQHPCCMPVSPNEKVSAHLMSFYVMLSVQCNGLLAN